MGHSSVATTEFCTAVDDDEIRAGRRVGMVGRRTGFGAIDLLNPLA
jgi:hypothetical protein